MMPFAPVWVNSKVTETYGRLILMQLNPITDPLWTRVDCLVFYWKRTIVRVPLYYCQRVEKTLQLRVKVRCGIWA